MRRLSTLILFALASAAVLPGTASADVLVTIDKATQRMNVAVDGQDRYSWPVSTGVPGHDTPSGSYTPFRMDRDHFSKEWDDAPMPNSIFFTEMGHAIHGTGHVAALGRPASHGCVRLSRAHSAELFALVKAEGMGHTRVVVEGDDGSVAEPAETAMAAPRYGRARYDRVDDGAGGYYADDGNWVDASRRHRPARLRSAAPPPDDGYDDSYGAY
ncbi:L,D-transpeptidase [Lichenibacterium dinghuense]|uniref:L,D-transpeptidase n=1 Tax=Lichenibacterium dinghuense TaxID=2895977 RepID=UPI001F182B0C|nr:L,D-transpeptidase [Lichenibacterium sp. 6Y81]